MQFSIWMPDYYYGNSDSKRARARKVEINPGFTTLVGPNGTGKTTFLKQIADACKENDYPYVYYDNMSDGGSRSMQSALSSSKLHLLAELATESEGEGIYTNLCEFASTVGALCAKYRASKSPIFVLMDGIDSGLSIDKIMVIRKFFIDYAIDLEHKHGNDNLFIICTANNYELARNSAQLSVCSAKYVHLNSYAKFSRFIIGSSYHKEDLCYAKKSFPETEGSKSCTSKDGD